MEHRFDFMTKSNCINQNSSIFHFALWWNKWSIWLKLKTFNFASGLRGSFFLMFPLRVEQSRFHFQAYSALQSLCLDCGWGLFKYFFILVDSWMFPKLCERFWTPQPWMDPDQADTWGKFAVLHLQEMQVALDNSEQFISVPASLKFFICWFYGSVSVTTCNGGEKVMQESSYFFLPVHPLWTCSLQDGTGSS